MHAEALVRALADLSRTATHDVTAETMLQRLCEIANRTLDVDGAGVMITSHGVNRMAHASPGVIALEMLQSLQLGPCREAADTGSSVIVPDLHQDPRWPPCAQLAEELGVAAVAAVPLVARGLTWGVLDLYRDAPGAWSPEELQAAAVLAHVAVSYLTMAHDRDQAIRAQHQLAHQATHDTLTGLPNRALLFDRLEHALSTARRQGTAVAVLFIDLDRFKQVNDTFGHTAGDTVLIEVARRLAATRRGGDTLGRLAGATSSSGSARGCLQRRETSCRTTWRP